MRTNKYMLAETLFDQGMEAENNGDDNAASLYYLRALEYRPAFTEALINLGRIYATKRALDNAVVMFRRAIITEPTHAVAWFNLGVTEHDRHNAHAARKAYERAIELDPDMYDAVFNLKNLIGV